MKIIVRNKTEIPNRYIRLLKWKLYKLKDKFKDILYAEVFIDAEGSKPKIYSLNLRLGIPGYDAIIKNKNEQMEALVYQTNRNAHQVLANRNRL